MKKSTDPRHQHRIDILKDLFSQSFHTQTPTQKQTNEVLAHQAKIDHIIETAAPQWPLEKVAKIDLAVLRLAIFELVVEKKEPPKVIIDEAVELAKEFGGESSGSFINGVLGTVLKNIL